MLRFLTLGKMTKRMIYLAWPKAERSPKQHLAVVFQSPKSLAFSSPSSRHPSFQNATWAAVFHKGCQVTKWNMSLKNVPSTGDSSSGFNKSQVNGIWNHPSACKDSGDVSRRPRLVRAHHVPDTALSAYPVSVSSNSRCWYYAHLIGETIEA